jgi:hypothetical protein
LLSILTPVSSVAEETAWLAAVTQEFDAIAAQIRQFRADSAAQERLIGEALEPAALIADADRDPVDVVLRRTQALLNDIRRMENAPDLVDEAAELAKLIVRNEQATPSDADRMTQFSEACRLRRQISFSNPLLDFQHVLFLKHHRARYEHMVDQYFGFHAIPGGGVYVLEDAFDDAPRVRDVLADSLVQAGRLGGRSLENGSFISLDLSFDAKTILFAWTEAEVPVEPTDRTPLEDLWKPESTYHIFSADLDGSNLVQLTDGPWNDFDPCWMPDGRICFISERRGGFLRCGIRPDPTYTLHSMECDGADLKAISYHETHEWHPSVNNDGLIVYSRWDYVDRDSDIAHHLWLTYPDGYDPRSFHGNYPSVRESRPWMELSIRAVPNSRKYIAVATPHHGQNYGTLMLIDLNQHDDGSMSQIKRITPDVAIPESETAPGVACDTHGGRNNRTSEVYGTPWPLSEKYHLCVYDPGQSNYGLYLVDAFGNRELLYVDPGIACLDPIPLRQRPTPPILPSRTIHGSDVADAKGYVAIMDIYESALPWPENTKITDLRVIQLYPKTTPAQNEPNIGIGAQSLARAVVGTAPVEEDGSVYCEVPVGAPIYFQALDGNGRAVQSMRSDTYVHPGQTLSCVGCHESKSRTFSNASGEVPMAMQRKPSVLKPDVEGSNPVLFPRLVQPVLDRHCVECHGTNEKAPGLDGTMFGEWGWSQSYRTLSQFAWAKHGGNGALRINGTSYSVPGEVGARASELLRILEAGHHDVNLPEEDLHRITLWLDCNSLFYGAYHETVKQARGETVTPTLR